MISILLVSFRLHTAMSNAWSTTSSAASSPTKSGESRTATLPTRCHLDEMVVSIKGHRYWLWRAVDANGYVLDAILQSRRNRKATLRLMRKLS